MTAVEALATIPYLKHLSAECRDELAASCVFKDMSRGAYLFSEGGPPAGVFLIVHGRIRLVRSSAAGREQVLHEEGPGVTLGEVPVFDGGGYVGSAMAVEDARVLLVPRDALLAALDRSPGSALDVIHVLARRVRTLAAVVEDLSLRPVTERIAAYLCREAARHGTDSFDLPVTRDELAAHVGTVREQASRALSQMKADGLIDVKGRRVSIREPGKLKTLGGHA